MRHSKNKTCDKPSNSVLNNGQNVLVVYLHLEVVCKYFIETITLIRLNYIYYQNKCQKTEHEIKWRYGENYFDFGELAKAGKGFQKLRITLIK